jgi:hypothetical protein
MNYFFCDFETPVSKTLTISKMTLRQYLYGCAAMGGVMGMSYALNDEPVRWLLPSDLAQPEIREGLAEIATSDDWTFVAHNAAFDVRVWRFLLNLPQPKHVHCTMEFAYAAWPCHPGGYGLGNLSKTMNLGFEKLGEGTKVMHMSPEQLALYCCNDTELCRAIHKRALTHLCADEIAVAELCNAAREMFFEIDQDKLAAAQEEFVRLAQESAESAVELLGDDGKEAFGWDGSRVRSVKPDKMKRILLENFGFDTHSISIKKINPMKLGTSTGAMQVLKATEQANKALSHSRRVAVFQGSTEIDVELGYYRAHTGRFSSPQPGGRGINIHNCPKRVKRLAKAVRSIFRLPDYACFVRADFANVEYRMEGWLTGCQHVYNLFERDPNADPYAAFWFAATGKVVTKADPARQIAKAAVLGLGYGMGIQTWIATLLLALADPTFGVTLADLNKVCEDQGWGPSGMRQTRAAMTKLNAPWQVATVAEKTREMFHQIHPEFFRTARWLVMACEQLNRCGDIDSANRTIDRLYELPAAPMRDRIGLSWTDRFEGRSVRVTCGHWAQPTVTWRDIDIRPLGEYGGIGLTNMHGTKGYRSLSPQITIENVVQSASRNALCKVQLDLRRRLGYEYQLSVHDEALLAVERTPQAVIEAKKDLIDCVAACGYGWAVHVDPTEVNVSQSLYEVGMGELLPPIEVVDGKPKYHKSSVWWDQLATHPELLEALP